MCNKKIIYIVLFLSLFALASCQNANTVIVFSDPIIEAETRRILDKPVGDITAEDVWGITAFGANSDNITTFGDISGPITTLADLKWFKNLKILVLSGCHIDSLSGIEELTSLQTLYVRRNNISSLEPVRKLRNLVAFDCADNDIVVYSALYDLTKLENLSIGENGSGYTDLSPLKNLTQLKSLYAPWCGISDLAVLSNMDNLEYLQLFHNNISDVSALKELPNLTYLVLRLNKITDIEALEHLSNLEHIDLHDNPIPENVLQKFYEPKADDFFKVTFGAKIKEDMPEFVFDLEGYFAREQEGYAVERLTVTDASDGKIIQTIAIPELTCFGHADISIYDRETMGFELEDMNFDGYQDIRLFDTPNGNYRKEWIYLIWDQDKSEFANDKTLNAISLASFDQEKQLIYGMERGSAVHHQYYTYKYIDGAVTLIEVIAENPVYLRENVTEEQLAAAAPLLSQ
jgi:hypothetical protein